MFTVVHGTPQLVWVPVINTDTLYNGQLVRVVNEGATPLGTAIGAGDVRRNSVAALADNDGGSTATHNLLYGVVVGNNNKTPVYNSTQLADSITYAAPSGASAEAYVMTEGPWAKGDRQAMVHVAIIDPSITLRGNIFTDTISTAPTVQTVTTASSTTQVIATTGSDESGIVSLSTIYFRSGSNAGSYRVTDDISTTTITWDIPLTASPTVGDTFVRVNLRPNGICRMQLPTEANFIDVGATVTSNYFIINVVRLDLSVAGQEYVDFKFDGRHLYTPTTSLSS